MEGVQNDLTEVKEEIRGVKIALAAVWKEKRTADEEQFLCDHGFGPSLSTDEKKEAAAAKLHEKEMALLEKEKILMQRAAAGPSAGAATGGSEDARERFEKLLKGGGIRSQRQPEVMRRLLRLFALQASMAKTADEAVDLYQFVKELPSTTTRGRFVGATGYQLNGPSNVDGILLAFDDQGKPYMFKQVRTKDDPGKDPEVVAALSFAGGPSIVQCEFLQAESEDRPGHVFCGLLMPKFERSLEAADVQLSDTVLLNRARAMVDALNYIHSKGYVHMDIKAQNVFVDRDGKWWVGDFGSCVRHGSDVMSTTAGCFPHDVRGKPAAWEFDWYMLGVVVASQLAVKRRLSADGSLSEAVARRVEGCGHAELQELLSLLLLCDAPQFE